MTESSVRNKVKVSLMNGEWDLWKLRRKRRSVLLRLVWIVARSSKMSLELSAQSLRHAPVILQIFYDLVRQINRKNPDHGRKGSKGGKRKCNILWLATTLWTMTNQPKYELREFFDLDKTNKQQCSWNCSGRRPRSVCHWIVSGLVGTVCQWLKRRC